MKILNKSAYLIFFSIILFNTIIVAQPLAPNLQNWNIKAAKCIDGDGDVELQNSFLNGVDYTKKITLAPNITKTIIIQLPALQNNGMFVFSIENNMLDVAIGYYYSDDGITWSSAQALYSTQTDNQLQKIDIPKSQSNKWMKFTFKNNKSNSPILKEFGLYEFRLSGRHNYFLVLGASITASAGGLTDWRQSIQNKFPTDNYNPMVFNWAVSGSKTVDLYNKIDEFLGQHPYAAYVLVETGGNDVTTTRPLIYGSNDTYITTMDTRIRTIIQKIISAGKIPVFWRLSFRDYKNVFPVNQGKNQENGSLPYNFTVDKIIKDLTPDFYNNLERRGMVDFYSFTLNNQSWLQSDGIHFNPTDTYHIRDCWIDNAIKYIYKGTRTNPIPYNEYVANLTTLATNAVGVAESSKTDKDIYNARILVEQIANTPTRIALLDRLDNINNPQPKIFYLKSTGDISDINSWGSNTDGTGTIPLNFSSNSLTLNINREATINNNFIANGLNSKLVLNKNKNLIIMPSANLNSVLDLEDGSTLDNQSTNQVTFGNISPTSTVIFSADATIPSISFGKITLAGSNTKKKLNSGTLHVAGDLLIKDQIDFSTSASDNIIDLKGNLTCQQNINTSDKKFLNFVFSSSGNQLLSSIGINALFNSVNLTSGTKLNLDANTKPEIGSLILNDGSKFTIGNNTISITTSLNPINQKGQIESNGGSVNFNTVSNSYFYTSPTSNLFNVLNINALTNNVFLYSDLSLITSLKLKTGNFDVTNGNLILLSNNSSTASIQKVEAGASLNGKITVQRFIPTPTIDNQGWIFVSSPVKNQTVNNWNNALLEGPWNGKISNVQYFKENWLPNPLWKWNNIYSFQNFGWFETVSLTENIQCGKGYKFFLYNSFFQGNPTLINTGDPIIGDGKDNIATAGEQFIFPVTYQLDGIIGYGGGGWNLISNPYPSSISWTRQGWTKTNIDNAIYIWNPSKKSYGTFIKNIGTNDASGKIASGQAFFIKANNNNPVLTASEDVKTDTIASFLRTESDASELLRISIINDKGNSDENVLYKDPTSNDAFNGKLDALKLFGEAINISSIKSDSISLSIHSINENVDEVKLSVLNNRIGKFSFLINGGDKFSKGDSIFLLDNFLQKKIHLKENLNYNFELTSDPMSFKNSRFAIVLHSKETRPHNLPTDFKLLIHSNPALQNIVLNVQTDNNQDVRLLISDMVGKLIYDNLVPAKFLMDEFKIPVSLSKGMYILSCKQGIK